MTNQNALTSKDIPLDPNRWPLIFMLLSMDVVVPFYELMGLRIFAPTALRDSLRAQILQARRNFASQSPAWGTYSPEATFDALTSILGAAQRDYLRWWGQRVFAWDIQEHRNLKLWETVLRYCADETGRWLQLNIPDRLSDPARQQFLRTIDREPYDQLHAAIDIKPLSDWDLHLYAINLFDDEDPAIPTGPSTYVYPTFKNYQGYSFWAWLTQQLTSSERDTLLCSAKVITYKTESLLYIGELPSPSQLGIGP